MKSHPSRYSGYRFPPEIISYAVWAYHRFCLSLRDVEDLLAERGIIVAYETIRQWCQKFTMSHRIEAEGEHTLCCWKHANQRFGRNRAGGDAPA